MSSHGHVHALVQDAPGSGIEADEDGADFLRLEARGRPISMEAKFQHPKNTSLSHLHGLLNLPP
jgi:hypothetical protein